MPQVTTFMLVFICWYGPQEGDLNNTVVFYHIKIKYIPPKTNTHINTVYGHILMTISINSGSISVLEYMIHSRCSLNKVINS